MARAIFYDEDDARAVLARLERDGWSATLERERLAGEDDDEDHPWALLSDAPVPVLEMLVEEHDGWLDEEAGDGGGAVAPPAAPPLPDGPRRVKRPDLLDDRAEGRRPAAD
ncbi:hypothetical protein [Nocardioides solisilvae]|uniref:hypothetical protein n=1 Tax=Nocardioides solisilvae TaxID=1542435 RepID=UPI0013A5720B|nr:hypothetical protein [Nocardioides solisilvae]